MQDAPDELAAVLHERTSERSEAESALKTARAKRARVEAALDVERVAMRRALNYQNNLVSKLFAAERAMMEMARQLVASKHLLDGKERALSAAAAGIRSLQNDNASLKRKKS